MHRDCTRERVKMTAEAVSKNSSSHFSMKNFNFAYVVMQWNMSAKFGIFFCFWLGFFTLAWMKNYCYLPSLRISFIWSPVFGNFRFLKWTVPSTLISAYLIYGDHQAVRLFSLFALFKYLLESYSVTTRQTRKEINGH